MLGTHCRRHAGKLFSNFQANPLKRNISFQMEPQSIIAATSHADRTYENAIQTLNTLQSNADVIQKMRKEQGRGQRDSLPAMEAFLTRLGISASDLNKLNAIHVSGTKGKGSTCAVAESIMRHHQLKTGLYTSPHLVEVRERIRINGKPLPRQAFADYFFHCYDMLSSSASDNANQMPGYFRFLTAMAFHVFLEERVDVGIIEVGIGGAFDCTNIIPSPTVCGISLLDLDHVGVLGDSISKIAWHKAGIMKPSRPAITIPQEGIAMDCLFERAKELGTTLRIAPDFNLYDLKNELHLEGKHQEINASLAIQLCNTWFLERLPDMGCSQSLSDSSGSRPILNGFALSSRFESGVSNASWPGRCQTIVRDNLSFYLDGAHTKESVNVCVDWLVNKIGHECNRIEFKRILLFNISSDRDSFNLLEPLNKIKWDHVVFCPSILTDVTSKKNGSADVSNLTVTKDEQNFVCVRNQEAWLKLTGKTLMSDHQTTIFPSINEALTWIVHGIDPAFSRPAVYEPPIPEYLLHAQHLDIAVVGSLHLVGGVLKFLGPDIVSIDL